MKANKDTSKPINMPPWYDALGVSRLGGEYHTTVGQKKFADYLSTPEGQKEAATAQKQYADQNRSTITMQGGGMFGKMPQDSQNIWYEQYEATGRIPPMAYRDAESRNAFTLGYAKWLESQGRTGSEALVKRAEYKALTGSLSNQEKVMGMMGGFVRNLNKQVDRVATIGRDVVDRVGVRALDLPLRDLKTKFIGSGNERVLEAYLIEISNEIGKLSTGSSASIAELSVGAQERWNKIHDPNLSFNELIKILNETKDMGQMRISSSQEEIVDTKRRMLGAPAKPTPSSTEKPASSGIMTEAVARKSLTDKGILGTEQEIWIKKYKAAGKVE
jgi:hypothetical protein